MAWIEISISVAREATPKAELTLEQLGALAITLEDDEDNPVLEPGPGATPLWPTVQVRGLFEEGTDPDRVFEALRTAVGAAGPGHTHWREVGGPGLGTGLDGPVRADEIRKAALGCAGRDADPI